VSIGGVLLCFFLVFLGLPATFADALSSVGKSSSEPPAELKGVGIDEALGHQLDLSILVTKENGEEVPLSTFFNDGKPIMLSFVYYNCPGLCSLHLNGVLDGMNELDWVAGKEFRYLTVSFDARETPDLAREKKKNYLKNYKHEPVENGWHFLTAKQEELDKLTSALGFKYKWDEASKEWAHSSALIFISPKGLVTRYLHGVIFEPDQLKLALNEAVSGTIGTVVDKLVWYCFRYDPKQSKYVIYAFRLVQIGGGLIVLILALILIPFWRRERKSKESV